MKKMEEEKLHRPHRFEERQPIVPHNIEDETARTLDVHAKEAADCASTLEVTLEQKPGGYTPRVDGKTN